MLAQGAAAAAAAGGRRWFFVFFRSPKFQPNSRPFEAVSLAQSNTGTRKREKKERRSPEGWGRRAPVRCRQRAVAPFSAPFRVPFGFMVSFFNGFCLSDTLRGMCPVSFLSKAVRTVHARVRTLGASRPISVFALIVVSNPSTFARVCLLVYIFVGIL